MTKPRSTNKEQTIQEQIKDAESKLNDLMQDANVIAMRTDTLKNARALVTQFNILKNRNPQAALNAFNAAYPDLSKALPKQSPAMPPQRPTKPLPDVNPQTTQPQRLRRPLPQTPPPKNVTQEAVANAAQESPPINRQQLKREREEALINLGKQINALGSLIEKNKQGPSVQDLKTLRDKAINLHAVPTVSLKDVNDMTSQIRNKIDELKKEHRQAQVFSTADLLKATTPVAAEPLLSKPKTRQQTVVFDRKEPRPTEVIPKGTPTGQQTVVFDRKEPRPTEVIPKGTPTGEAVLAKERRHYILKVYEYVKDASNQNAMMERNLFGQKKLPSPITKLLEDFKKLEGLAKNQGVKSYINGANNKIVNDEWQHIKEILNEQTSAKSDAFKTLKAAVNDPSRAKILAREEPQKAEAQRTPKR